ncbi:hypothetical protein ACIPSE_46085 [Streptomyces sp. NPDC090106]|uniref:hypothetical protein n=1 Tax=Streptomyces sp. NPDC090106 TaxID=3365946 RepID=UPI0037F78035
MRSPRFQLFADCLLLGVLLLLCSLPLVTAFAALTAGCAALRELAHGGPGVTPATLLAALRRVLRSGPVVLLAPTLLLTLLWLDAVILEAHGGTGLPFVLAGTLAAALLLRCAAGWREGTPWRLTVAAAFRSVPQQPLVLVLLAGACAAVAALLAMSPVLIVILLGPLALAATAADAWRPLSVGRPLSRRTATTASSSR